MSKAIREHISNIQVEKSNLQHIADTGKINGSLLLSIEKIMQDYSQSKTQELQEQNSELVEMLEQAKEKLYGCQDPATSTTMLAREIEELITKYEQTERRS